MNETLPIADIPVGFFEYRTTFNEPIFSAWYDEKRNFVKEMYRLLLPWGVDLEKVSWNAAPKNLKEAQVTFSVPSPSVLVNIGIGGLTLIASNANWSQAETLTSLFQTIVDHLQQTLSIKIESQQTVLGFHVKPGPTAFRDVMKRFVNAEAFGIGDVSMYGVGVYGSTFSLLMDISAAVAGGLFVKITRVFPAATHLEEMASILWKDEEGILHRLGFRTQ